MARRASAKTASKNGANLGFEGCGSSRGTKKNGRFRDRRGETLFIDARKLGTLVDRVHREIGDADIARIAGTYHAWRGDEDAGDHVAKAC